MCQSTLRPLAQAQFIAIHLILAVWQKNKFFSRRKHQLSSRCVKCVKNCQIIGTFLFTSNWFFRLFSLRGIFVEKLGADTYKFFPDINIWGSKSRWVYNSYNTIYRGFSCEAKISRTFYYDDCYWYWFFTRLVDFWFKLLMYTVCTIVVINDPLKKRCASQLEIHQSFVLLELLSITWKFLKSIYRCFTIWYSVSWFPLG